MSTTANTASAVDEYIAHLTRSQELALAWVRHLRESGDAGKHRAVSFRCTQGCSMLEVYPTREGTLLYRPRYRLSEARSLEVSNAAGRAANTEDGIQKWNDYAFFMPDDWRIGLLCKHLGNEWYVTDTDIRDALHTGRNSVIKN